jgi:UDP-N-acetylglucosamine acyltransferase
MKVICLGVDPAGLYLAALLKTSGVAADVEIGPYAIVGAGVVLGAGVKIGAHAVLEGPTTIGAGTRIFPFASIGSDAQDLKYRGEPASLVIGARNIFREHVTVNRGTAAGGGVTRIGDDNLFMAGSHVAHDCTVGNGVVFANAAALAGHVVVQDRAVLGGFAGVHQHTRVADASKLDHLLRLPRRTPSVRSALERTAASAVGEPIRAFG